MFPSSAFRQENYWNLKMYECLHKIFIAVFGLLHKMQYNWHQLLKHNTAGRKENLSSWERKREFPSSICFVFVPSFCIPWWSFKDHDYKTQEGVFGKLKHQTVAPKKGRQIDLPKNLLPSELMKSFERAGVMHRRWRICCSCCVMLGDVPRAHVMLAVTPFPLSASPNVLLKAPGDTDTATTRQRSRNNQG